MKRFTALALGAFTICGSLPGLEVSSAFSFGNLAFSPERDSALSAEGKNFSETWNYGGSLEASERIGENFLFAAGFERDAILRNTIYTRVGYDAGFARISVGPFFGPFNAADSVLTSGISTILRLELPGVAFASFRSDSTIGAGLAATGDYVQERSELVAGFWVPNLLVSARLATDAFTLKDAADLTIVDERTRYELVAEAFKKNVPYTVKLNMGYENLKRSYEGLTKATSFADELGAAIIGLELSVQATDEFRFNVGAEGALYAWGIGDLGSPSSSKPFFTARAGVTIVLRGPSEGAADAVKETPAEEASAGREAAPPAPESGSGEQAAPPSAAAGN